MYFNFRSNVVKSLGGAEQTDYALRLACETFGQQSNRSSSYGGDNNTSPESSVRSKSYDYQRKETSDIGNVLMEC